VFQAVKELLAGLKRIARFSLSWLPSWISDKIIAVYIFLHLLFGSTLSLDMKASTKPILVGGDEQRWGFGQIFPMLMLLGLMLYTVDVWRSVSISLRNHGFSRADATYIA